MNKSFTRWLFIIGIVMLALRIGYKLYRQNRVEINNAERMDKLQTSRDQLIKDIQADQDAQRAAGARPVLADTTAVADSAAARP